MTESLSQTQLIEDTNRFGKCKGATSFVNSNSGDGEIYNYNSNIDNNNNGANHHRSFSPTTSPSSVIYTVVLQPFDSHFPVKTIEIKENTKCRIGRQSNAKTVPKPLNGYFDSKVLSRNHAILWSEPEGGGVWIKDTKSSNGTFLNGHRLSEELEESEPFELKTGDQIAFGIDIIGEDGSILYHKVACSISIFNIPVDQMDLSTLKGFNLMNGLTSEGDTSQQRRSSVSSVASGKDTITNHSSKPMANQNKQWELLLAKLEIEFHRSQDVEKELLDLKEAVGKIDKTHDDDRLRKLNALNTSLQDQLDKAQRQLDEYAKKTQLQDEALSSAHKQLLETRKSSKSKSRNAGMDGSRGLEWQQQLEQMRLELVEEKKKYDKDLAVEKSRCNEYEQKCATLERQLWTLEQNQQSPTKASSHPLQHDQGNISPGFVDILHIRSVQILVGVMVAIISALIYISI